MTSHEEQSRAYYASVCRLPAETWEVVRDPVPGVVYDFADAASQTHGQCWKGPDGKWRQEPLGKKPVILGVVAAKRKRSTMAKEPTR